MLIQRCLYLATAQSKTQLVNAQLFSTIMLRTTASQVAGRALRSGLESSGRCFTSVSLPDLPYDYGALEPHIPAGKPLVGCCIE